MGRGRPRARGERTGESRISVEGSLLVNTIHVWAAYREAKTIYYTRPLMTTRPQVILPT